MGKSRKKNPISGYTCKESEKFDKRIANRRFRKKFNNYKHDLDKLEEIINDINDVSNVYSFSKDGKKYLGNTEWEEEVKRK